MKRFALYTIVAFSFMWFAAIPVVANEKPDNQRIDELEKALKDMKKEVDELKKGKSEKKSTTAPAAGPSNWEFGYKDGFFLQSKDKNYHWRTNGALLMGVGIFENNTVDDNGIFPGEARLTTTLTFFKRFTARLQVEFAGVTFLNQFRNTGAANNAWATGITDAYLQYYSKEMPFFGFRIGNTHVPFTIEGQYDPHQSMAIWASPFIANWAHGRDPGVQVFGTLADMFEYKLGFHNGEGSGNISSFDDFLYTAQARIYFMGKEKNSGNFFHIGVIRGRDTDTNTDGNVNSATLTTPWGRQVFDPVAGRESTSQYKTGIDIGIRFEKEFGGNKIWLESEFMYITWDRDFGATRVSDLEGWGYHISLQFLRNIFPKQKNSGVYALLRYSYTDVDDRDGNSGAVPGQRLGVVTLGAGYVFNKHVALHFNWLFVRATERSTYSSAAVGPKASGSGSDALEMAWFVRFDITW